MMKKTMILGLTIYSLFYSSGGHSAYTTICKTQNGTITFCPGVSPQATVPPVPPPQATIPPVPPPQATSPNWCRNGKPRNPTEDVICMNPTLWAWDVEYNKAYQLVLSNGGHPDGKANLNDRNKYVLPNELAVWYQSAISQLTQSTSSHVSQPGGGQGGGVSGVQMDWCKKKLTIAESILCAVATTAIVTLDNQINVAYKTYKKRNDSRWQQEKQKQIAWLEQRNAFILSSQGQNAQILATTLIQMYQSRLAELKQ